MNPKKTDLRIVCVGNDNYRIHIRKRIFKVFWNWIELTYKETENTPEHPMEFKTLELASNFIDIIAD